MTACQIELFHRVFDTSPATRRWVRPVSNGLLPCRIQIIVVVFFFLIQHGRSTTFEIILEFGSTEALGSTGSDVLCRAVWHGLVSNDVLLMCQSEMNSNLALRFWSRWHGPPFLMHFKQIGNFRMTFETASTPLPYFWQTHFIWIRHGSSATFETGLRF